ncbi:MAG: hypothetical protein HZB56_23090 [Deltaproteobacteria bacterium]|nr:hypothetical protein [Deltaproteobacteria bacterium]
MLPLACAGLLASSLAATPSLDLGVVAEGRYRTAAAPGAPTERFAEAELAPWIKAGVAAPGLDLAIDYRPLLTLTDGGGGTVALLHQASLLGRWKPGAEWSLSAQLGGRTGKINRYQLFTAGVPSGDPTQPFPSVATLGFRSLEGTLGLGVNPGLRHRLQISLTAADEGGARADDRRWLPRQQRLRAMAGLEWDMGPHDVLASVLDATGAKFSDGPSVGIAGLTETWRHAVSSTLRFWVGGGPAWAAQRQAGVTATRLLPAAEAGAGYDGELGRLPWKGTLAATLAPFVDRITGAVPERVGLTANLVATPSPVWRVEGYGAVGRVVEGLQKGDQAWGGSFQVGRSFGDFVDLAVGVRGIMQRQPRIHGITLDWNVFLLFDAHPRRPDKVPPDPSAVPDPLRPRAQGAPEEHQ